MLTKVCTKCVQEKDVTCFAKDSDKSDSLRSHCKECMQVWRFANRERESARRREWARTNPEKQRISNLKANLKSREVHRDKRLAGKKAQRFYPELKKCCVTECFEVGHRHHPDYRKPLEIVWLCPKHHSMIHRENRVPSLLS